MKISMKYLTIFMLVMVLCCVSAVSATDINGTDDITEDVIVDEVSEVVEEVELDDIHEDIVEEQNVLSADTGKVNGADYSTYFDTTTGALTNTAATTLTFTGNFNEKAFSNFVINRNVTINANDATFNNLGFTLSGENSKLIGGTFNGDASTAAESVIYVTGQNAEVKGVTIDVVAPTTNDYFAINVYGASYAKLLNNIITYNVQTATTNYNHVIRVVLSNGVTVYNNTIKAYLPLKAVDFDQVFPSIYTDQVAGVAVQESNNFNFTGNTLDVIGNAILGYYPTLDALIIVKSHNSYINGNTIDLRDNVSGLEDTNYLYAVDVYECNNINIDHNVITINSKGGNLTVNGTGAAYGIQLTGPHTGVVISNNNITTANNGPNLGIYSQNYYGGTSLTITGNRINVTGRAGDHPWALVSGMELQDDEATVYQNTIYVNNLAGYDENYCAYGISYSQTTYTGDSHTFEVYNNTVVVENGTYAVYLDGADNSYVYDILTQSKYVENCNLEISNENNLINEENNPISLIEENDEQIISDNSSRVIFVDQNKAIGDGNGTFENPFSTISLACSNVSGEDKITLNIYNGTYFLGSELKFNTSNLIINGINGVVIKSSNKNYPLEALELTSSSSNFTMNNIIFDASGHTRGISINLKRPDRSKGFLPFYGGANLGIFNNCTFSGFKTTEITGWASYKSLFSNCIFEGFNGDSSMRVFYDSSINEKNGSPTFKNCIFSDITVSLTGYYYLESTNCSFIDCWFGQNELPNFLYVTANYPDGTRVQNTLLPIYSYAVFSVSENYLGNDQYEIIGKLTWNGTDNQDGMENFQPMTVTLNSATGEINQTATLVNGNFRTVYTSSNPTHKVTATLDAEEIELEFTTVNITADPVSIYYGDDQNITFNFTQPITANVTVTVTNGSYNKSERVEIIDKDSFTYTVHDTLKEGTYDVEINLSENNLFGFNTTTLTVSKVSDYTFNVVTADSKVGDNATVTIELPEDVNGTVIVKFGNDTKVLSANQTMTVNFTNLNATRYNVNVSYSGNDKYAALDKLASVTVDKADSVLEIEDAVFTYGDVIAIPYTVVNANGVTVSVYNKDDDEVATNSSESGTINLDTLPAGEYILEATTIVDSNYEWVSEKINLTINKANSSINIEDKEFAYAKEAVINTVTENSTGDVIATLTDENNTEITVTVSGDNITLPKLSTGKYTLNVTTNVDDNHNNISKSVVVTIVKAAPEFNVVVDSQNITSDAPIVISINLPEDATGLVLLTVDDIKLFDEVNDGILNLI